MTETNDQSHVEAEGQVESKIAQKFAAAREDTMKESQSLSEIYRSITKPGFKDVYGAWVKNMDAVANSYSWGKDKPGIKTHLLRSLNKVVGVGAATFSGLGDLVVDTLTWLPRKTPIFGSFIPKDIFKKHTIKMSESAKNEAFFWRGAAKYAETQQKIMNTSSAVVGEAFKRVVTHDISPELRAAKIYTSNKVSEISKSILHPKPKAV